MYSFLQNPSNNNYGNHFRCDQGRDRRWWNGHPYHGHGPRNEARNDSVKHGPTRNNGPYHHHPNPIESQSASQYARLPERHDNDHDMACDMVECRQESKTVVLFQQMNYGQKLLAQVSCVIWAVGISVPSCLTFLTIFVRFPIMKKVCILLGNSQGKHGSKI